MVSPQESDPGRLRSVDAYRGFVMLAMASGGIATFECLSRMGNGEVSIPLEVLLQQFDHVPWRGCVFWDLIQPSFMFLVGVSMPLSYSRRRSRGDRWTQLFGHALFRSVILVVLGVFLASNGGPHTNFIHERAGADRPRIHIRSSWCSDSDRAFNSPSRS